MRSLLAFWIGGGAADTTVVAPADGGYRSLLGFWSGGAAGGAVVIEDAAHGSGMRRLMQFRADEAIKQSPRRTTSVFVADDEEEDILKKYKAEIAVILLDI